MKKIDPMKNVMLSASVPTASRYPAPGALDLVGRSFTDYWVYVAGPLLGATLAVGAAFVLRGSGGGKSGSGAAQGGLFTELDRPGQA